MAAAQQTFYNPPWPSPLYQTLNVLIDYYNDPGFLQESIFSQPIFELFSTTAGSIFKKPAVDDREVAFDLGKDLLQTSEEGDYEIVLNGTLRFRYNFDPGNRFSHTADGTFNKEELEKYVEAHKNKPESNKNKYLQQAQLDLENLETKPPELQAIEQLYTLLTGHSCRINNQHFLFILLGIQQSNATEIINKIRDGILEKIPNDLEVYIAYISPVINKIIFDIECDQLSGRLKIRATLKYYLKIITDQGEKKLLFPFELTHIVYDLDLTDLTDIENEKPGLTLQAAPVNQLVKIYSDCYDIIKKVSNVIKQTGEIDYDAFSTALEKKIKYRIEGRGAAVQERMALKGFMGGRQQKKSPRIRRVSKKRFKRSRREKNQRKSKQNK